MIKRRPVVASVLAISIIAFAFSVIKITSDIVAFNREKLPPRAHFMPVELEQFTFGGRLVSFSEERDEDNNVTVVVTFGDTTLRLNETIPNDLDEIPDLRRYEDWLRVYRFVMVSGMSTEQALQAIERDEIPDRLVIVVRTPPPGADQRTWGEVWSDGWVFDLYELKEDGTIQHDRLKYPSKRRGNEPPKPGELVEGTWQYDTAMMSIPPVSRPKPQFESDASFRFGWAISLAGVSGLALAISAAFLFAPPRRTE